MPNRHIARLLIVGVIVLSTGAAYGQNSQQPKPGPEHKKLEMLTGEWKYEGEAELSPFGPAGKFAGKETNRMVLDGFFVESRWEDVGDSGYVMKGVILTGYDPLSKKYVDYAFDNDGIVSVGSSTWDGKNLSSTSTRADRSGKIYKLKHSSIYSDDGKTRKGVSEYSEDDGQTWKLLRKLTATKLRN
jgi:hypothetical protein